MRCEMKEHEFAAVLSGLAKEERWEDVYVFCREHQSSFTRREQRMIRAGAAARMSPRALWRTPSLLMGAALLLQLAAGGIFQNQIPDLLSFLGRAFRPYMYAASVLPLVLNLGLAAVLAVQCRERLILTFQMFRRPVPWGRAAAALLLALALAAWSLWSLIPYAEDLPLVLSGRWNTGVVTEAQIDATARNNALVELGRAPEGAYDPIPWYSNPRWSKELMPFMPGLYNRWVCDIHVDDVICRMGRLQFDMTDFAANTYPIRVEYLPHSRLVLWISCGE